MRKCSKHGAEGGRSMSKRGGPCRCKSDVTRSSASLASLDSMDIEGLDTITEEPAALAFC